MPGTVVHTHIIPALGKLRQQNYHEFKDSLGYTRFCLKRKKEKNKKKNKQTKKQQRTGGGALAVKACGNEFMNPNI